MPAVDAIDLLTEDHARVLALFDEFARLPRSGAEERKQALARRICTELAVHAQIEEEIFYPAARAVLRGDAELMDEAWVEHLMARELIAAIAGMEAEEMLFDAKVAVLGEYVRHHVREEQDEMFARVRATALDCRALGDKLARRRDELLDEFADVLGGADSRTPAPHALRAAGAALQ
jgi:hypothetical protein